MSEARQPEEPFARDPLAIRLQQLDDLPMSHELLPRVLSGAHALKVPVWRRFRGTAVLAGALVVLVAVVAATPVTRGYVGELLDQMGLRQTPAGLLLTFTARSRRPSLSRSPRAAPRATIGTVIGPPDCRPTSW